MNHINQIRVLAWPPGSPTDQNPYVTMMYSAFTSDEAKVLPFTPLMRRVPHADIFHIQWPESIFEGRGGKSLVIAAIKAFRVVNTAKRIRCQGGAVVLTAHNLNPHARLTPLQKALWARFHSILLSELDLIIGLSQSSLQAFITEHPRARNIKNIIIAHPHYRDAYPLTDRKAARERFGLKQNKLIGVVGSLRPSKNVLAVIEVFRKAASETDRLLLAGACEPEYEKVLKAAIEDDSRIIFHPRALSDVEISEAFAALDICLINQTSTLNSGTAFLALSQGRALAAPNVGALTDLYNHFGKRWVYLFEPPLNDEVFRSIMNDLSSNAGCIDEKLAPFSPLLLSAKMLEAFRDLNQR